MFQIYPASRPSVARGVQLAGRDGLALLRMPWTAMMRRLFTKNHSTRVFNLPT
jgi:hypothetical protein